MKLNDVAVDLNRIENGTWIDDVADMPGLRIKVRGASNHDWRKLQAKLIQNVPRKKRLGGNIDMDEAERINNRLLLECGLIDWEGLEGDDGKPLPFTRENAEMLLNDPQYRRFRDAVSNACNLVGEQSKQDAEDAAGNLVRPSFGTTDTVHKSRAG